MEICRAEERDQRGAERPQSVVLESRWQPAVFSQNCRNTDPSRIPSHLVPHWQRFFDRFLKLAISALPPSGGRTPQYTTFVDTRRASSPCALSRARFLKPCLFLAFRLSDGSQPLGTVYAAALAALLVRKGRRWQPEVEAYRFGRHTPLQVVRVGCSHRRTAFVFSFLQCHHLLLGHKVSRQDANETRRAASHASDHFFLLF